MNAFGATVLSAICKFRQIPRAVIYEAIEVKGVRVRFNFTKIESDKIHNKSRLADASRLSLKR